MKIKIQRNYIIFIYFIILYIIIGFNQLSIYELASSKGSDHLTFFLRFQSFSINNIDTFSKDTLHNIFIFLSQIFSDLSQINNMDFYILFKGLAQLFCTAYFADSISRIYGRKISLLTFTILLLDPYLFSLKLSLMRDDLIYSFGLLSVGAVIRIKESLLNKLSLKDFLILLLGILGLLTTRPVLGLIFSALSLTYFIFDSSFIRTIRENKLKKKWLFLPLLLGVFSFDNGGYIAQAFGLLKLSLFNIYITFRKHFLSPLPGKSNIINVSNWDTSAVYWWMEIRFFLVLIFGTIIILSFIKKPILVLKSLSFAGISGIIISLLYSQAQNLETIWGYTAGPRQGYLSYLLLVPGSLYIFSKVFKIRN